METKSILNRLALGMLLILCTVSVVKGSNHWVITQITDNDVNDFILGASQLGVFWSNDPYRMNGPMYVYDGRETKLLTETMSEALGSLTDSGLTEPRQITDKYAVWVGFTDVINNQDPELFVYDGDSVIQLTDNNYYSFGIGFSEVSPRPTIVDDKIYWQAYRPQNSGGFQTEIFQAVHTPEPATLLLLAFGGLAMLRRKPR